jgi:succinate dehydrogenase hydrophobic anchor subunit
MLTSPIDLADSSGQPRPSVTSPIQEEPHECTHPHYACPRRYLTVTGFVLAVFLVFHLGVNLLGFWPARFQAAVNRIHGLGSALPVLETSVVLIPLLVHIPFGLRVLWRDQLRFSVNKRRGSAVRQWLQQVSGLALLAFLAFHVMTLHHWFGGRFNPHDAFHSLSQTVWNLCGSWSAGASWNPLFALLYPLGLVAALYHSGNGVSTGADILGLTPTPTLEQRLWSICLVAMGLLLAAGLAAWYALAPL